MKKTNENIKNKPEDIYVFNFNSLKTNIDGYIFLTFAIIIPALVSLILKFLFSDIISAKTIANINAFTWLLSPIFSLVYSLSNKKNSVFKNDCFIIFAFMYIPLVSALIFTSFSFITELKDLFPIIGQCIGEVIVIVWAFVKNKDLLKQIKETFKNHPLKIFLVSLVGFLILFLVGTLFINFVSSYIPGASGDSSNQEGIAGLLKSKNTGVRVFSIMLVFILTVLVAPLAEELATRHSIFKLSNNKILGLFNSALYFAGMHFISTGDWEHSLTYLFAGFALAYLFIFVKGNFVYTWITHTAYNLLAFILMLVV